MILKRLLAVALACRATSAAPALRRGVAFAWGSEKVRGVNVGGWLVLEPWITPSLFDSLNNPAIVDELSLGATLGHDAALSTLRSHWDSWVTLSDFQKIRDSGFNLVRIPIGYWAYDTFGSAYVQGQQVEPGVQGRDEEIYRGADDGV